MTARGATPAVSRLAQSGCRGGPVPLAADLPAVHAVTFAAFEAVARFGRPSRPRSARVGPLRAAGGIGLPLGATDVLDRFCGRGESR
ncbi:hypothetical protein B1H29_35205 [Streptomyces pactum]|uniref:Uncharacterized protein n=1 Tax=Streptomyces pactum TaxID=68249 RepID=A0A1S6JI39_9ACTN|nr:hypothetical protein B1H29_35205 [Streptomyces pactum]